MRVFLDTNVILDLIQRRVGYDDAALIMQKSENGEYSLYTSSLSMVNIAYIVTRNAQDFIFDKLPIYTPFDFLNR